MKVLMTGMLMLALVGIAAAPARGAPATGSALLGALVLDAQGQRLGTVLDLALNMDAGSVAYAIVDYGAMRVDVRPLAITDLRPGLARDRLVLDPTAAAGADAAPPENARLLRASTVLGMKIEHPTGADYGVIDDIVVDLETARVQHVVVRLDAGVNGQKRELPFSALRFPEGSAKALLTLGKKQ